MSTVVGFRNGNGFLPRQTVKEGSQYVSLCYTYSKSSSGEQPAQQVGGRKTYRIDTDGNVEETGLRWEMAPRWDSDWDSDSDSDSEVPELDSEAETVSASSSRSTSPDAELEDALQRLSGDDLAFMEEMGLSEKEFAEYIAQADSFGTCKTATSFGVTGVDDFDEDSDEDFDEDLDEDEEEASELPVETAYAGVGPLEVIPEDAVEIYPEDLAPLEDSVSIAEAPLESDSPSPTPAPEPAALWASIEHIENIDLLEEEEKADEEESLAPAFRAHWWQKRDTFTVKRLVQKVDTKLTSIGERFEKMKKWSSKLSKRRKLPRKG